MPSPIVSIVIPTRDDNPSTNAYLKQCLKGIELQTYPADRIEIVIVCVGKERSEQRNYGIARSHGKYVMSLDDDHFLTPTVIEEAVKTLESDSSITFLCVSNRFPPSHSLLKEVRRIERDITLKYDYHIAGCFFLKSILPDKPFNESLYAGEDYELHQRLCAAGYRYRKLESIAFHLKEPERLSQVVRQNLYYGAGIRRYLRPVPGTQVTKLERALSVQPFRLSYLYNLNKFRPTQFLYFLVYQYTRYASALIGMVAS